MTEAEPANSEANVLHNEFFCPISMDIMRDPVVAADGFSYDREFITTWLLKNHHSPLTGRNLSSKSVTPNHNLRSLIDRATNGTFSSSENKTGEKRKRAAIYENPVDSIPASRRTYGWYQIDIHQTPNHASYYCAHACSSGLLMFAGGFYGAEMMCEEYIRIYDTASCEWNVLPFRIPPIAALSCITFGVQIFAFGGFRPDIEDEENAVDDVWSLNIRNQEFELVETTGQKPPKLMNPTSVVVQGNMLIFGGGNHSTGSINDVYSLDLRTLEWTRLETGGKSPAARLYHGSVMHENYMYIFGGAPDVKTTEGRDAVYGDFYRLDTSTRVWQEIPLSGDFPTPRGSHCMFVVEKYIYLFGGFNGVSVLNDLFRFDTESLVWENITQLVVGKKPAPRAGSACLVQGNRVYIYGGFSVETADFNEMFVLEVQHIE